MSAAIETTRSVTLRPWQATAQDRIRLIVLPVKPRPPTMFGEGDVAAITNGDRWAFSRVYSPGRGVAFPADPEPGILPPFNVGDELIGREKWKCIGVYTDKGQVQIEYAAGGRDHFATPNWPGYVAMDQNWRAARRMPDFAARFRRTVTSIGVKRVHQITDAEVVATGIDPAHVEKNRPYFHKNDIHALAFGEHWQQQYAKTFPWKTNCWCWFIGLTPGGAS